MVFSGSQTSMPNPNRTSTTGSQDGGDPDVEFVSIVPWGVERPETLVIACSDGRLRGNLDDFLQNHLGIAHYDRLYLPGGPGGMAGGGAEYMRAAQMVQECEFLIRSHGTSDVVLVFHGATEDGPEEAVCADYRRKFAAHAAHAAEMQGADLKALLGTVLFGPGRPRVRAFRADVDALLHVRFTPMAIA
jgi:hypothetical protein